MTLTNATHVALHAIGRNKLRSVLTALGIIIGVGSLIVPSFADLLIGRAGIRICGYRPVIYSARIRRESGQSVQCHRRGVAEDVAPDASCAITYAHQESEEKDDDPSVACAK